MNPTRGRPMPTKLLILCRPTQESAWPCSTWMRSLCYTEPQEILRACLRSLHMKRKTRKHESHRHGNVSDFSIAAVQLELDFFGLSLSLSLPAQDNRCTPLNIQNNLLIQHWGRQVAAHQQEVPVAAIYSMCSICVDWHLCKIVLVLLKYFQKAFFWRLKELWKAF